MKDLHKKVMDLMEITMFKSMEKTLKCFKKLKKFKEKQANEEVNCNLRGYCSLPFPSDYQTLKLLPGWPQVQVHSKVGNSCYNNKR